MAVQNDIHRSYVFLHRGEGKIQRYPMALYKFFGVIVKGYDRKLLRMATTGQVRSTLLAMLAT